MKLEELTPNAVVRGLAANGPVTIKGVTFHGSDVVDVVFVDGTGKADTQLIYRDQEGSLELVSQERPFSFTADGHTFKLATEAQRIRFGHLFDPLIAVSTSSIDPLPHQISAVYETMLDRRPLRFLLADDPGAGKTIMTGLLLKELIIRGDTAKCLIVAPGSLVDQWQDEMSDRFNLHFDILTNDAVQASRSGNWFLEHNLCICRLDKLSRDEDLQDKLRVIDWDMVVVDEAHKMSAHFFGSEVKYTKRYQLGQLLSASTRQLLLLTATPHNGKDEDFQLFLALLDGDRFEGKPRDAAHTVDANDLMRRLVKEELKTMEGKPLFPQRFSNTIEYPLSEPEAALYKRVSDYVREGFNRADQLEKGRRGTVGFALTILQRRLASSPEAIYQSLHRRRARLEKRLRQERIDKRGAEALQKVKASAREFDEESLEDLEDAPDSEQELAELQIVDLASAAMTISELEAEIGELKGLEKEALKVRNSGVDSKWTHLRDTLSENPEMHGKDGHLRKLVIFTEQRDTLNYLEEKLKSFIGRPEAVLTISGNTPRDKRRQIQESFQYDPQVSILIATDAAGEGINLQRAHLMVNYDLPWNPNRLEQRFGRIHRIGQTETCHLWNLVSEDTREGDVFQRLLEKLETEKSALGGAVYDVLGSLFRDQPLKDLLVRAIREADTEESRAYLHRVIDKEMNSERFREIIAERSLTNESLSEEKVGAIRKLMAEAEARKLQPHYIGSFFAEAFQLLGGKLSPRETRRYEIRNVPAVIRNRDIAIGRKAPVLKSYERVTFHKENVRLEGKAPAALVAPGHPLLDATIDLILEKHRDAMREGTVLLDPNDPGTEPRLLFLIDHAITDGRKRDSGDSLVISRRLLFNEINKDGQEVSAGYAPYLDYVPLPEEYASEAQAMLSEPWLGEEVEKRAVGHAIQRIVPDHLSEVKQRRLAIIEKTRSEVHHRLTREINYWDQRANDLEAEESAGKTRRNLNSRRARDRAEELQARLRKRMEELDRESQIVPRPPRVLGAALVIPQGALTATTAEATEEDPPGTFSIHSRAEVERLASDAVMAKETALGNQPRDVSSEHRGYDIESFDPETGQIRHIEVKGRIAGAKTVTVTRNEILTALNRPEGYILAIVEIADSGASDPTYLREPFSVEPDFATASVNFKISELKAASVSE